ncbi:MAG: hypothetical protein F4X65_05130 [Chloroflexi bacterium]|nr:hypothetical protein [Chloroflexota bacterium]
MRILFDVNMPDPLRFYLTEHIVDTAREKGWSEVINGNLLENAERDGYEVLVTADQSMRYQQNMTGRQVAVIVLLSNRWPDVQSKIEEIRAALEGLGPGEIREVPIWP